MVLALGRPKQQVMEFKTKLGYKVTPCLKKKLIKNNELCDTDSLNYSASYNGHVFEHVKLAKLSFFLCIVNKTLF